MKIYEKILSNEDYFTAVKKIENTKFITNGKWDWEHGLGHYKRVAKYVEKILSQLNANERTIELGITVALLHDIGLVKGSKTNHAIESGKIFDSFIPGNAVTKEEKILMKQAIEDHSNGNNITSLIGLALFLGDKLDVTYHRTINSSIQDKMNKEIQKIKDVDIVINDKNLIVTYKTEDDFDVSILNNWKKAITTPKKASDFLDKEYLFFINNQKIEYKNNQD